MQQNGPLGIPLICMSCPHIDVTTHKPFRTLKQCDKKWPFRVKSELWSASQLCSKLLAIIYLLMCLAFEKKKKKKKKFSLGFGICFFHSHFSLLTFWINIVYAHRASTLIQGLMSAFDFTFLGLLFGPA